MDNNRNILLYTFIGFFIGFFIYSCANKGYPEGGPRDTTPPHVIDEIPESFTTNFSSKSIRIYFDEYVQLKNMPEKLIVSPPQSKKPRISLRGKYIYIEFQDSLRENATYSLDFGDGIADNNEGNPLGYYRYVFSTGSVIDSLEISGVVVDGETNEPVYNAFVFLYENHADSVPILEMPNYMAATDSSGFFRLTNLRQSAYRVIAIKDNNRDYKFTPEGEEIAFLDTLVNPFQYRFTRTDTIRLDTLGNDSLVTHQYIGYGPTDLYLRMFEEKSTQLYISERERPKREVLNFVFSIPGENEFSIRPLNVVANEAWYLLERSIGKDTLNLWITDSVIYNRDTLNFELTYLRTDSTKQWTSYIDTTRLVYTEKKIDTSSRRRQRDTIQEEDPYEFLKIDIKSGRNQDLHKPLQLEFNKPIFENGLSRIELEEMVDSLYNPIPYTIERDSIKIRTYYIKNNWKPEGNYRLILDSAAITDIYGFHNDSLVHDFRVKTEEDYGKIFLNVEGVEGQVIIQLYRSESRKSESGRRLFTVVDEKIIQQNGQVIFTFVDPGKYEIRAIFDENRNGEWDTGLYLRGEQPERVVYLPVEINVRQNFDIEQNFDLNSKNRIEEEEER